MEYRIEPIYEGRHGVSILYEVFRNDVSLGSYEKLGRAKEIIKICQEVDEYNESLKNKNGLCQK